MLFEPFFVSLGLWAIEKPYYLSPRRQNFKKGLKLSGCKISALALKLREEFKVKDGRTKSQWWLWFDLVCQFRKAIISQPPDNISKIPNLTLEVRT